MSKTEHFTLDERIKFRLLTELASGRTAPIVASSCHSMRGLPKNFIEIFCQALAQEGLITCEIQQFIGHRETFIQVTDRGRRYLDRTPNQE